MRVLFVEDVADDRCGEESKSFGGRARFIIDITDLGRRCLRRWTRRGQIGRRLHPTMTTESSTASVGF